MLDMLFAVHHEGERPNRMARVFWAGAVTGGLTAPDMAFGKRTGKQIVGNAETAQQLELALSEASGVRTFRLSIHLVVILPQDRQET